MQNEWNRRQVLQDATLAAVALAGPSAWAQKDEKSSGKESEPEVTATEDLMREHGVIRRALLVYDELAQKIRKDPGSVDAASLHKMKGRAAEYPDVLIAQHNRGREVTDYVLSVTSGARIASNHGGPLADVLVGFVRMYENHAAREDTIVFPAWKTNFTNKQLDELSDQFEEIEHKMFGKDGFEDAENTISKIEASYGFTDISQF